MITQDPQARALRLAEVEQFLQKTAQKASRPAEDAALLLSFGRTVFAQMADAVALAGSAEQVALRLTQHFDFFTHEVPPAHQTHRGVPGLHVKAHNPGVSETRVIAGRSLSTETTVVETHTLDAPFIFASLKGYLQKKGLRVISSLHPILAVKRQWGRVVGVGPASGEGARELFCHFHIEKVEDRELLREIEAEVFAVLKTVFLSVEDFQPMLAAVRDATKRMRARNGNEEYRANAQKFLEWLLPDNYTISGVARYAAKGPALARQNDALGVFRDPSLFPTVYPGMIEEIEARPLPDPGDDRLVVIEYGNHATAIHTLDPIDDILIREFAEDGSLAGVTVILGRFNRSALIERPTDIPILASKEQFLLETCGGVVNSHSYRETRAIFNRMPKRELFYTDRASLKQIIDRIVHATGDDDTFAHLRPGPGYVALYVVFSRARYSGRVERELTQRLSDAFGPITLVTPGDLGQTSMIVFYFDATRLTRPVETARAQAVAAEVVTTWTDLVALEMILHFGEAEGRRLFDRYIRLETRSGLYREATPPEQVPHDIAKLEALDHGVEARAIPHGAESATLKVFSRNALILSETLRTLTNLGIDVTEEVSIPIVMPNGKKGHIYQFETRGPAKTIGALATDTSKVVDALRRIEEGRAVDDPLAGLILDAGLSARQVEILRALRNHLLQLRTHYNVETVNQVFLRNGAVSAALYGLFAAKFDASLTGDRAALVQEATASVAAGLERVASLQDDEALRGISGLIEAALRTNAYQTPERPVLSIKFESKRIPLVPSPRPMFEIAVHSKAVVGVHLRGGKVARGGIRWSDRHDDFRREVLGLMKTQMVKNSIIVPVGSKGGFVLKGNVPARPALDAYLIDRYREYVSGLLDVTDNIVDGRTIHPPDVIRYDGEDPYLVVAADKGTAHLSDTANGVSAQYGFWLGDAFASGGSVGYDHKKVGITARGAWECVKHHFANLGVDCQTQPFTCVAIGDMAGDVFGNGMLQSRTTRLVAAFNHAHIFIDPNPDAAKTYPERDRLFQLPRSSWRDYDAKLISAGGGVFDRGAKSIVVTPEMKKALGIEASVSSLSGEEMIRAILRAPVDLLYNGGIGTYIKASVEEAGDVGDRANDRVRIDATEVRAKMVSEGGNLGLTQKARLELARRGVLLNTDAVDNSGGVDMSDHEVNIKIQMGILLKAGAVKNVEERNRILAEMTEEVAELCLDDNRNQGLAITLDRARSRDAFDDHLDCIDRLVDAQFMNREDDSIPARDELSRDDRTSGLPRPLLAILLGETKRWAFDQLMDSDFPSSKAGDELLKSYFPGRMQRDYGKHFAAHPLKREIVGTVAINHVVNTQGVAFIPRALKAGATSVGDVVAAFFAVSDAAQAPAKRPGRGDASNAAQAQAKLLAFEAALGAAVIRVVGGKESAEAAAKSIS